MDRIPNHATQAAAQHPTPHTDEEWIEEYGMTEEELDNALEKIRSSMRSRGVSQELHHFRGSPILVHA